MAKRTRRITKKRVTNVVKLGGNERDRKAVWERLVALFTDRLPFNQVLIGRETEETTIEEEIEFEGESEVTILEQEGARLTDNAKRVLEAESIQHDKKLLAQGKSPDAANADAEETAKLMLEISEELRKMREEGFEVDFRELGDD